MEAWAGYRRQRGVRNGRILEMSKEIDRNYGLIVWDGERENAMMSSTDGATENKEGAHEMSNLGKSQSSFDLCDVCGI